MNVQRASFDTRARTWLLLAALTGLFIAVGILIGGAALWFFVIFSVVMNVAAYWWSAKFAIASARAQEVTEAEQPELHRIVEELAQLYGLPKPRVYLIPSDQPNAFATGRNKDHAAIAVTQGLLQSMPRDQVRGVLAHEFGHIANRDILVSSIAAMIAGAISAIGSIFFWFGGLFGNDNESPLGIVGVARHHHHRADRGVASATRGLTAAGVSRGCDCGPYTRHGRAARPGAGHARARPPRDARSGKPGDFVALHRQPARQGRASPACSRRTRRSRIASPGCANTTVSAGWSSVTFWAAWRARPDRDCRRRR